MWGGEGKGDGSSPLSRLLSVGNRTDECGGVRGGEARRGESEGRLLVEARGVALALGDDVKGGVFAGRGKRGPLSFLLRRGRRKKVVVVDTV